GAATREFLVGRCELAEGLVQLTDGFDVATLRPRDQGVELGLGERGLLGTGERRRRLAQGDARQTVEEVLLGVGPLVRHRLPAAGDPAEIAAEVAEASGT